MIQKYLCKRLFTALLITLAAVAVAGCDGPAQAAILTGVVTSAKTGQPLFGARVSSGSKDALTNSDGQFVLQGVSSGTRPVTVELEGYEKFSTAIVLKEGMQELNVKLSPESTDKRFAAIDKLIAAGAWIPAIDGLEKILKANREDLDVLSRLAIAIDGWLMVPSGRGGGGATKYTARQPQDYLRKWGFADPGDPYAVFFEGALYSQWALNLVTTNSSDFDRPYYSRTQDGLSPDPAGKATAAFSRALLDLDVAIVRRSLGRMCHWSANDVWATGSLASTKRRGGLKLAEEHLLKAIESDPTEPSAYRDLALVYTDLKDCEQANSTISRALTNVASQKLAGVGYTDILAYIAIHAEEWQAALDYSLECIKLDPREPMYHAYAGRAYAGLGDMRRAMQELTAAEKMGLKWAFYTRMLDKLEKTFPK